jgi:hypothetical protein
MAPMYSQVLAPALFALVMIVLSPKVLYKLNISSRKTSRKPHAETTKDPRFNVSP